MKPRQLQHLKEHLKMKNHTYRSAAQVLGVSYQHVSYVLNGQRLSEPLCQRILRIPRRTTL